MLFQCWTSGEDGGSTLKQHWVNAPRLLGMWPIGLLVGKVVFTITTIYHERSINIRQIVIFSHAMALDGVFCEVQEIQQQ